MPNGWLDGGRGGVFKEGIGLASVKGKSVWPS